MRFKMVSKHVNEFVNVEMKAYGNGVLAILLLDDNECPVSIPSVNLAPEHAPIPNDGYTYIKLYSESEGMLESLVENGVVEDTGVRVEINEFGSECALVRVLHWEYRRAPKSQDQVWTDRRGTDHGIKIKHSNVPLTADIVSAQPMTAETQMDVEMFWLTRGDND